MWFCVRASGASFWLIITLLRYFRDLPLLQFRYTDGNKHKQSINKLETHLHSVISARNKYYGQSRDEVNLGHPQTILSR